MRATVSKTDTNRAFKNLDRLLAAVREEAEVAAKNEAEAYADMVRSGIGKTVSPSWAPAWQPLSYTWMAMKKANKNKFWMETGGIMAATDARLINKTNLHVHYFAGIRKQDDPDAYERARRNEYGMGLGPARPLFLPAMDQVSVRVGAGQRRPKDMKRFQAVVPLAIRRVWKK